mgnify:CR=1 FL=1
MPENKLPRKEYKIKASACLPLMVMPYTKAGKTRVYCCGMPEVISDNQCCHDIADGGCSYIIRQHLCVDIPVRINASAFADDPYILCQEYIQTNGGEK